MITGTATLPPNTSDEFYWYADATAVQIKVGSGSWVAAVAAPDPNGTAGWRVLLAGPAAGVVPGATVLAYGINHIQVKINGGTAVTGGTVYVGYYGVWLDPYDQAVYSYVSIDPDPAGVDLALRQAADILGPLSGYKVHPAGAAVEDFRAVPVPHRISPAVTPLQEVLAFSWLDTDGSETVIDPATYRVLGQSVYFRDLAWAGDPYGRYYPVLAICTGVRDRVHMLRLSYRYGSTINAAARQALLLLARQLWLAYNDAGACELPERVMSITREGLSFTLIDPQTFLDQGRVGIPRIDMWLRAVNPSRAQRPSGVWTPTAPPGVNVSNRVRTT